MTRPAFLFLFVCVPAAAFSHPQTPGPAAQPQALTLDQAIQYATDHYPSIRAVLEQATASAAGVDVARSAYLPRLDAMWQSNRATVNNVFGQVLPQGVLPALSGPVLPVASSQSVWSSATGALLSWEPLDFGLRHAAVASAEAALAQARATQSLTRLDVQTVGRRRVSRRGRGAARGRGGGSGPRTADAPAQFRAGPRRQSAPPRRRCLACGGRTRGRADPGDSGPPGPDDDAGVLEPGDRDAGGQCDHCRRPVAGASRARRHAAGRGRRAPACPGAPGGGRAGARSGIGACTD